MDYANGLTLLPAGTYFFETIVPITCQGSDSIINAYTAIVENTPANGINPLAYGPETPSSTLAPGGTMQLGDWQTGSVYGTGTFTLSVSTYVSMAFAQFTDTYPAGVVRANPYEIYTGSGYSTTILKLWKTA